MPTEVSVTIDTRDFPGASDQRHRAARRRRALRRSHERRSTASIGTKARPPASCRSPAAASCWRCMAGYVGTEPRDGGPCPFYLQPSLGGLNTLRSYTDYRFHDDQHAARATPNCELALMTHLDLAVFADAGNVAARAERSRSREAVVSAPAFGCTRAARPSRWSTSPHGDEGWRVPVPLEGSARPRDASTRRATLVPFVP